MFKKFTLIFVVMLVLAAFTTPVLADPPNGDPPYGPNGWEFSVTPQKACFPATGSVPATVRYDITVNAPQVKFPLTVTFDPYLFSGVLPHTYSVEITESGTTTVGYLHYFTGIGTTDVTRTFTIQSKGKTLTQTVTVKVGLCPVIGQPGDDILK